MPKLVPAPDAMLANALEETGGPTVLDILAIADNEILTRSGTTIVGAASASPSAHALGGAAHTADTLANLNAKISDATLDDVTGTRTPTAHASAHELGGSDEVTTRVVRLRLRNETGGALAKGTLISVLGFSVPEDLPLVVVADKDEATKRPAMGVTTASVPNNSNFEALVVGLLDGLDTSAFSDNDQLVLGDAGAVSRPPPETDPFTGEVQLLGSVVRSHASLGSIYFNLASGLLPMTAAQFFLTKETGPTGSVSGGEVTRVSGRDVAVAAGSGFVNDGTDIFRVTWSAVATLTLAASDTSFVFVDKNGVVQSSVSPPSIEDNIVLADAITDATTVLLLANHQVRLEEIPAQVHDYARDVVGPITVSGINTTKAGAALRLDVAAGTFYTRSFRVTVGATAPVTFTYWFRDGSGGFTRVAGSTLIDKDNWDDGTGVLNSLVAGEFKKDLLFVVFTATGLVEYHVFYGQEVFTSQAEAESGALPAADSDVVDNGIRSGGVVIEGASATIASVVDVRPVIGQLGPGATAVTDHGLLSGLSDDDHNQYQLRTEKGSANGYAGLDAGSRVAQDPKVHALAGADHSADTLANLNAKISDGTVGDIVAAGAAGTAAENAGTAATVARSDHEHAYVKVIQLALEDLSATGDGQQKFVVPVPNDGWTLEEIHGELRTGGASLDIQIRELNTSRVSQGDVMTAVLSFGAALSASTTTFLAGRITPDKNFSYTIDIDASTGVPAGLLLQLRFFAKTDNKVV